MKQMPRRPEQLTPWRTGDHQDVVELRGWRLFSKTWNPITSSWMKQLTWLRISGVWCLRLALCTASGACQRRMWRRKDEHCDALQWFSQSVIQCLVTARTTETLTVEKKLQQKSSFRRRLNNVSVRLISSKRKRVLGHTFTPLLIRAD